MKIIDSASEPATLAIIGSMSIWHWLIVLVVVLLLFGGGGKIPRLMKDVGTGIKSFKKGLKEEGKDEEEGEQAADAKRLEQDAEVIPPAGESKTKTTAGS